MHDETIFEHIYWTIKNMIMKIGQLVDIAKGKMFQMFWVN